MTLLISLKKLNLSSLTKMTQIFGILKYQWNRLSFYFNMESTLKDYWSSVFHQDMHPDQEVIMKEVEETIVITMKMVKEEEEEEIEEVEDVEEETMEVKKGVKDKKAMKAEDNIEVEEEAEDIVTIEEETEVIVIIKKVIEEKREFIKINKLVNYLKIKSKLK